MRSHVVNFKSRNAFNEAALVAVTWQTLDVETPPLHDQPIPEEMPTPPPPNPPAQ